MNVRDAVEPVAAPALPYGWREVALVAPALERDGMDAEALSGGTRTN
jgi:hypothetical protein